jgi:hypothetical protein
MVMAAALLGLAIAYGIDAMSRAAKALPEAGPGDRVVVRSLGGRSLTIPAAWLRTELSEKAGFSKQIELDLALPLGPKGALMEVGVTLLPRSQVRPSASLLDGVYLHQFQPEQLSGPPGLIGKPLAAVEGYQDETVWYDPISPNPFVAKCLAPVTADASSRCLRAVYLGTGIAAIYDFDAVALERWREFDTEMTARLGRTGAL